MGIKLQANHVIDFQEGTYVFNRIQLSPDANVRVNKFY